MSKRTGGNKNRHKGFWKPWRGITKRYSRTGENTMTDKTINKLAVHALILLILCGIQSAAALYLMAHYGGILL